MASEVRGSSLDLKLNLLKEGYGFSFFQVIRLVHLLSRGDHLTEGKTASEAKNIKIRPDLSLAFPASDVACVEELPGEMPSFLVTATFLGLYGVSSPLPTFYTEDLLKESAEEESVTREFIDIINHHLYLLFFGCLSKYRQFYQVVEEREPLYLERLYSLLGIGEEALRRGIPSPYSLIRYAGILTQFPRSALGLKTLLQDSFSGIPIDVIPCRLRRLNIPEDQRMYLGVSGVTLGMESFLGEEIDDRMGSFRLQIGPVTKEQFYDLLPGGENYRTLLFLTRFYLTDPLEYDIDLILLKGEVRTACLGCTWWSRLGLDTWVFSGEYAGEIRATFYPQNNEGKNNDHR